ncbi:MAG: radical SAM protein [Deltaproteobacteria bacterium]|nr:radical SAM protein [Deltaproteobacteria bacterium]
MEEIKEDIQKARDIADDVKALSWRLGRSGVVDQEVIRHIFSDSAYSESFKSVAAWLYYGEGSCFLQDADNMVMKTRDLVEVLRFLREKFPEITRVTTYGRSRTIVRKSVESMKEIHEAGLDRIHIGMESGCDTVLKMVKKGVTGKQHIEAGRKVMEAGIELSEYIMPGLGGQALWKEHAVDSARVLNAINPHFIRLRSLRVPDRVPLHAKLKDGSFLMQTDDMLAEEIKLFIEHLEGITSTVTSDHIMNLLEEVSGTLPGDKEKMLRVIEKYQALPDTERLIYRVGRRGGAYASTDDLERDPVTYGKIKNLVDDIVEREGMEGVERFITEMVDRYI